MAPDERTEPDGRDAVSTPEVRRRRTLRDLFATDPAPAGPDGAPEPRTRGTGPAAGRSGGSDAAP